ncbi:MAG: flagellar biosynthetic protein FliQ [Acidobacteriales bacterium]|nr:flagellar biosynthetic protein FliQ [Candidatus Koribacter versatilis]MBI3646152.1 flagellar biosynthetic protein FliQ [Terriglobales bacterium]
MNTEQIVALARNSLEIALWLGAPLLLIATVVSLLVNVVQTLTSLQDSTISTVPRLAAVAVAALLFLPWMLRKLMLYTVGLWSDFHPYLR